MSVIVPVYKAEKYIESCVSSILAQTYGDFELILVDDGSPDRSGESCDALAATDTRIRVIHKENGGAATARNAGLDAAKGDFIAFIDGDDCVHPQYLEFLLALQQKTDADFAMCYYDFFTEEGEWFAGEPQTEYALLDGTEMLANFAEHCRKVSLISLCMKLFKKEIFDGLRIPEGFIEEDSMSLPHILERAEKIARSEAKLYHWRITPGSVTRSGLTEKSFAYIEVSRYQAEFFAERGSVQADHFRKEFLLRVLKYYYKVEAEKPELMAALKPYIKTCRKLFPRYIRAKGLCIREKIAYTLFLLSPKIARRFYMQVHGGDEV
ncbi:MAG: glycosyltransferase family 2 protein [Oscillospiraceae bacterium]|nr:glycosyltransferase family 2 protein [Oscillospiraceae bacterium]